MFSRNFRKRNRGYTLVEVLCAAAVFSTFGTALLISWASLGTSAMNTLSYCQSENDQLRCLDYMRRDIRRASSVTVYSGGTFTTQTVGTITTTTYSGGVAQTVATNGSGSLAGTVLQITLPKYYGDGQQEDDAIGMLPPVAIGTTSVTPSVGSGSSVTYGPPLTVLYYISNGVIVHNENGVVRAISDSGSVDSLSFGPDVSGLTRCRVSYTQTLRSAVSRTLHRQVDILCGQHSTL